MSRIYNPAMTAGDAAFAFSLQYSLKADDLIDLYSTDGKLRTRRGWMACVLALSTAATISLVILGVQGVWSPHSLIGLVVFMAISVLVGVPSAPVTSGGGSRLPG